MRLARGLFPVCLLALIARGACAQEPPATDAPSAGFQFRHHFVDRDLPTDQRGTGDYGETALVDLDHDGDLDFVLGGRVSRPPTLSWFEFRGPDGWTRHVAGTDFPSEVGLSALDVDGDSWTDLVCSGAWYRNRGRPREEPFERIGSDENAAGAHDVLAADIDGDGRQDIV